MLVGMESFTERTRLRSLSLVLPLEQVFHPSRIETDIVFIFAGKQMFFLLSQHFSHPKSDSSLWHFPVQAALLSSGKTQYSSRSSKAFAYEEAFLRWACQKGLLKMNQKIQFFTPV